MRLTVKKLSIAAVLVVAGIVAVGLWSGIFGVSAGRCQTDDELPAAAREPYEQVALRFARNVVTADTSAAYAVFSAEAKQAIGAEQFAAAIRPMGQIFAGLTGLRVAHTYFLTSAAVGSNRMVLCTAVAHGSVAQPEGKVLVAEKSIPEQAHVIVEGDSNNNTWTFVLWLVPEEGNWHVHSFHIVPSAAIGKSAADIWAMAREQRNRQHLFNAAILYAGASELAFRGPNFQLGIWPEIQNEAKALQLPHELQGQPPFVWQFPTGSYRVLRVGPLGVGGKMALMIRREVGSLNDNKSIDDQNRALIRDFTKLYPDYADVFNAIIIEAVEADGSRAFRTVEEAHGVP
jgi:hypothetical protein